jgi:hypothetical protein
MSNVFAIRSTNGALLEFREKSQEYEEHGNRIGAFAVALTSDHVSALCHVHYSALAAWAYFFRDLAEHWRGWEGEKRLNDLEFGVSCTADRMGHIAMRVLLQDIDGGRVWRAEATLRLEAGQLADIAAAAAKYFG